MNIRAKCTTFAVVAIAVMVVSSCYSGAPVAQGPQYNAPKPSTQQGYLPIPAPAPNPAPVPEPDPTPAPEPTTAPEA